MKDMSQIDQIRQEQEAEYAAPHSRKHMIVQALSNLFHPLLVLTYTALAICSFTPFQIVPQSYKMFFIGEVFLFSVVLPALIITLLHLFHIIGHWALRDRRDRMIPFFTNFVCYTVLAFLLNSQHIFPNWIMVAYNGSVYLTFIAWIVSFWWKISAHASADTAAATYFLLLFSYFPGMVPLWLGLISIVIVGGICSSRIYLGRHTLGQVGAGVGLGIASMIISHLILM